MQVFWFRTAIPRFVDNKLGFGWNNTITILYLSPPNPALGTYRGMEGNI